MLKYIEDKYVKRSYEIISESWKNLRKAFWFVKEFAKNFENKKVLDAGCGDCTQLIEFKNNVLFGIDFSKKMIKEAKKKHKNVYLVIGDIRNLPFKNKAFDIVLCIATLHHIPKRKERIIALKELKRVAKEKILISVLKRFSSLILKKFPLAILIGEAFLTWKYKKVRIRRYYHVYTFSEFKKELKLAGIKNFKIKRDKANFIAEISLRENNYGDERAVPE
ncbi:MAG: class I SAM-dependent methyltransferase [Candidatus Aenigmatarchaeota archaeon]